MSLTYKLHILSGPKQGSFFNIQNKKLSLGRHPDNDINLDFDPSCSRKHVVIESSFSGAFIIYNVSKNNKLLVNNKPITSSEVLKDGDNLVIGKTTFKIELANLLQTKTNPLSQPLESDTKNSFSKKKTIIVAAAVLPLLFLFLLPSKKKAKVKVFTSFQKIEKEIKSIKQQTSDLYKKQQKAGVRDQLYKKAQVFYLSAFREYKQGKYQNATSLFQACLSLIPEHKLCNRYIILARRKFLELIQYHMLLGQKYLKQHQNKACKTAFKNVMIMLNNTNNSTYKEAEVNFQLCSLRLKGQY